MMKIQPLSKQPIYLQLVEQIEGLIVSGKWIPGERLQSVRALANDLLINPNTVAKAYAELEERGFVIKRDRSGVFVADNASPFRQRETKRRIAEAADRFVSAGEQLGLGGKELHSSLHEALDVALDQTEAANPQDNPEGETDRPKNEGRAS